ncbi:MAG: UDP-N-acetylmuramoyl-L-alanyl-D-glutamate--2,6-diaminopimelate ligase [Pseudobdellovibrionaceae bacterium]|nr:UDP-N-acetylmuramoyl-L-alanyl-D-glutamate--2,6-diaminopimelate ligase [Pseudobdellovibrionaceae bacterium]
MVKWLGNLYDVLHPIQDLFSTPVQDSWKAIPVDGSVTRLELVGPQKIFVAIRGKTYDGHQDLARVLNQKPAAVVVEKNVWREHFDRLRRDSLVPILVTDHSRRAYAFLSASFWGQPSLNLFTIGVTGTNGKTSVTTMGEYLLQKAGVKVGKIGTLGLYLNEEWWETQLTTPDAYDLHYFLSYCYQKGAKAAVMEVSSHALDQFRVDGVHFDGVIFTHLTQDHLDYHGSMERYFQAKARLFSEVLFWSRKNVKIAVINIDDPWGQRLQVDSQATVVTYGQSPMADFRYEVNGVDWSGIYFRVCVGGQNFGGFLPMLGEFQVANFVGIAALLVGAGFMTLPGAISLIADFPGVPGRLQKVRELAERHVFIDFAHTPDALEKTLVTLRSLLNRLAQGTGRLGIIFGCGGERDEGKRPIMGAIAERLCDWIIVTNDNPRGEDPEKIVHHILSGMKEGHKTHVELDRKKAIFEGLERLGPNDVLLIAGKGHERYQQIGQEKIPFSDYDVVVSWKRESVPKI